MSPTSPMMAVIGVMVALVKARVYIYIFIAKSSHAIGKEGGVIKFDRIREIRISFDLSGSLISSHGPHSLSLVQT